MLCGRSAFAAYAVSIVVFFLWAVSLQAQPQETFYTQVLSNRLAMGRDASGIKITFPGGGKVSQVKILDSRGMGGELGFGGKVTWSLPGNLQKIVVTAAPNGNCAADPTSCASLYWGTFKAGDEMNSCKWLGPTNNVLGDCSKEGVIVPIKEDLIPKVGAVIQNNDNSTLVFTNIRLYYNQDSVNFNIDEFTNVTGSPIYHSDVTLLPGAATIISFSGFDLQPGTYQFAIADIYSTDNPSDVYSFGAAVVFQ